MINNRLFAALLLIATPALAQQVAPQFGLDTSASSGCRRLTVRDPQKAGADKTVSVGCVDGAGNALPPLVAATNPDRLASHIGNGLPDDQGSKTLDRFSASFSGTHSMPYIARSIEVDEEGSGIAASPKRAAYGLGIRNYKKNWRTTTNAGEIDGLSLVLRNGIGDVAGILSNVGVRTGFGATLESITASYNSSAVTQKAVRTQIGVVNDQLGYELGFLASAEVGINEVGVRVQESPSPATGSWLWAYANTTKAAGTNYWVRALDGAVRLGTGGASKWLVPNTTDVGLDIARDDQAVIERIRDGNHSILGNLALGKLAVPSVRLDVESTGVTALVARFAGEAGVTIQARRASADSAGPAVNLNKARGTLALPTVVQSGDQLGAYVFQGYSGSAFVPSAQFVGVSKAATPSITNMEAEVVAYAVGPGTATLAEVFRFGVAAGVRQMLPPSVTPDQNRQMAIELTSDTSLTIKVRGSDGVVRKATLTLAP